MPSDGLMISLNNFFEPECPAKFLHFFHGASKILHYVNLSSLHDDVAPWEQIALNVYHDIPNFSRSIATPQGLVFLVGGADPIQRENKLPSTFVFEPRQKTLIPRARLNTPRSSHSLTYLNGYIYAIGGITNNQIYTAKCERYSIVADTWSPIAPLNYATAACSTCSFNGKYIFKFGGQDPSGSLIIFIEKFDISKNKWTIVDASIDETPENLHHFGFKFMSTAVCAQINPRQILILGGYDENQRGSRQTFILTEDDRNAEDVYTIGYINYKPLPYAEGFWSSQAIIQGGKLYALQNVREEKTNKVFEAVKRVLVFTGQEWLTFN